MKTLNCLLICLTTLAFNPASGQQPVAPPVPNPLRNDAKAAPSDATGLTRFNLDFPGGTPRELVAAIQKATGRPLNAIILEEDANVKLPSLKMNNVTVPELFQALEPASQKTVSYVSQIYHGGSFEGAKSYSTAVTSCGFRTSGKISDDSICISLLPNPRCRW